MLNRRITAALLAFVMFIATPSVCLGAAAETSLNADNSLGMVTDVIVGRNNKGPYMLTWTEFLTDDISVIINGRSLRKGQDYNIDPSKGIIAFNSILLTDAIVRVSYRTIPGKSKRSSGQVSVPVSVNVFQGQDASLNVTGLYAQDDPNKPDATKTIVGFGGDKKWANTKLSSQFFLSQKNDDTNDGSAISRSAYKFGGATNLAGIDLTGSYLHSGKEFGGANEYGLGLGKEVTDLSAAYSLSKHFQASAKYLNSEDTAGATQGTYSHINEQRLTYSPLDATKVSMVHTVSESGTAAVGSNRSVDSSSVRLDQNIGSNTNAVASFDNAKTVTGSIAENTQTRQIALTSGAIRKVNLRSLVTQKHSDLYGDEKGFAFGVNTTPVQQVNVDVAVATLENQNVGHQINTDAKITVSPIEQVAVQASYSGTDSSTLGQTTKTNVSVKASPVKNVELQSTLAGNAQNQTEQFQRDFSLSSTPTRYTKLTALMSQKGVDTWDDVTKGAVLELMPLTHTQLKAGYRYIEAGPSTMMIRDYAATTKPCRFFSFNGSLRDREVMENTALDSTAMQLALSPFNFFTLTGDYSSNPEDTNGAIQTYKSKAVGLSTHIGSLGLTTNYAAKDEYMLSKLSDERKFGMELPLFGHGQLSTGYKIARMLDSTQLASKTYSLGYRHAIGSNFNLSLVGCYTQFLQNQMMQPEKTEYNAEASLGVKF